MTTESSDLGGPRRRWTRSYPPLAMGVAAVLIAVLVLPSALNLPQSNPSTVLEYAPVPPQDDDLPPPADGNLQSLGLGATTTLAAPPPPPPPPPPDDGVGARPQEKRCVGDPPRQTEDLASPPCVPFFDGDNFGETYQGVTGEEITVLVYIDVARYGQAGREEPTPASGTYVDIDKPVLPNCAPGVLPSNPDECDHLLVRMLKGFSRYFNTRYQTYKRRVHYWAYFTTAETAAQRRGDAVDNWDNLRPFAVIDWAVFRGFNREYQQAMTQLGVLAFSSTEGSLPNSFYREVAPLAWGFYPDVERWARIYTSYVCQKVAPHPVRRFGANSGAGAPNGQVRRFGLWWPNDPSRPDLRYFAELVKAGLLECGASWVEEATFSRQGYAVDATDPGTDAVQGVARLQAANVTTVLYLGGTESRFSQAADAVRYYPEIVIAGNLDNDNNFFGTTQNQNVWKNAWAMSYHIRINRLEDAPGFRAFKEGNPGGDDGAALFARDTYRDHFMLFQAIQVAGPRLTPESVDEGFHAIPEKASTDPYIGAFFFEQSDFTSLKDAAEQWWDSLGSYPGSQQPGCWRMVREGKRYLSGTWEGGDDVFKNAVDPCTAYRGGIKYRLA